MLRTTFHILFSITAFLLLARTVSAQGNNEQKTENKKLEVQETNGTNPQVINVSAENNARQVNEPSRSAQTGYFYRQQTGDLRTAVISAPKDATAWASYYKAERYANYTKTSNDIKTEQQENLDAIVAEMERNVPGTYEFHYIKYLNGNHDITLFSHLLKAWELNPNSTEIIDEFVAYYELVGNAAQKTTWCKKLNDSHEIPNEVMEFDYNVFASVEQNAVLITHGEMDTYPLFIWQSVKSVRQDVNVLFLDLLEKEDYRERKMKELGVTINADFGVSKTAFLKELGEKLNKRPLYFSATVSPEILKSMQDKLFITGVAFKYSSSGFDNLPLLMENWENKFKKDELFKKIKMGTLAAKMNMNYVPGLVILAEYLKSKGMSERAKAAEDLAIKIASEGGKEQQVKVLLKRP